MRFNITVSPVSRVFSCAEKLAQESRGLFGFHNFEKCPHCRLEPYGWEGWGSNGHLQFTAKTRAELTHVMKYLVLRSRYESIVIHIKRSNCTIFYKGN